ncbi:hypothetical protein ES703_08091 [subsurface metagenome]|nr:hypothetical protein [bacterium]
MRHSIVLRIVVGAAIIALFIPLGVNAEDVIETNEFIVKAPDSEALEAFVDSSGLAIGPLITYPNPSEEVLRYTRYTWIVSVPDSLQSVKDSLVEVLKAQPWVEYVEPNAIIQIEPEVEGESEGCLYGAIELEEKRVLGIEKRVASVNAALCKGCGGCAASCRSNSIDLAGFTNQDLVSAFEQLMWEEDDIVGCCGV